VIKKKRNGEGMPNTLWKDGENTVEGRFGIEIVNMWHVATGEVRIRIENVNIGLGRNFCYKGYFRLVDIDEDLDEVTSFDDFTP